MGYFRWRCIQVLRQSTTAVAACCSCRTVVINQKEYGTVGANRKRRSAGRFRKRECEVVSWLCAWPCRKGAFGSEGSASTKCVGDSVVLSDVGCTMSASQRSGTPRTAAVGAQSVSDGGGGDNWGRCSDPSSKVSRRVGELALADGSDWHDWARLRRIRSQESR